MSHNATSLAEHAAALRDAFDRSFAAPRSPDPPPTQDLLAIRVGTEHYALDLSDIAALYPERRITPLPGSIPALRGIAGFRGAVAPVYDLATLLGQSPPAKVAWLAMAANEPIAFAFAVVDGHLRVARDAILPGQGGQPHRQVRGFARTTGEVVHPIVDLASIINAVRRLVALRS